MESIILPDWVAVYEFEVWGIIDNVDTWSRQSYLRTREDLNSMNLATRIIEGSEHIVPRRFLDEEGRYKIESFQPDPANPWIVHTAHLTQVALLHPHGHRAQCVLREGADGRREIGLMNWHEGDNSNDRPNDLQISAIEQATLAAQRAGML